MLDVGQLVGHDPTHLAGIEQAQQARGGGHRGILRVAARGEGIGRFLVDQVDTRHRQPGLGGQLLDHAVELRCRRGIDLTGVVHLQHHLVRKPVGKEVADDRKAQRHEHPLLAAKRCTDHAKEGGDGRHQRKSLDPVEHSILSGKGENPWEDLQ